MSIERSIINIRSIMIRMNINSLINYTMRHIIMLSFPKKDLPSHFVIIGTKCNCYVQGLCYILRRLLHNAVLMRFYYIRSPTLLHYHIMWHYYIMRCYKTEGELSVSFYSLAALGRRDGKS